MVPIKNRISDVLMAGESRPFDAVLKGIFEKPRVLKNFADFYLRQKFRIAEDGYFSFEDDDPIEFLNDEFRPNQDTWHADKIVRVGEKSIFHIEQQTKHNTLSMETRMLHYAAYVTTYYDFEINLFQTYYYTGDGVVEDCEDGELVETGSFSVRNLFVFVDAGNHDAWAMLETGNPYFALLGLMARTIPNYANYLTKLLKLGGKHFDGADLRRWLVDCTAVACLRKRENDVLGRLKPMLHNQVINDPVIQRFTERGRDEGRDEGRSQARDFYNRTQRLKAQIRGKRMPVKFLDWIMASASETDMQMLESSMQSGLTFAELLARSGVNWNNGNTYGHG